jgi:aspartate dehydrogenase
MLKLGLLGAGAIGADVIAMVQEEFAERIAIPAVLVRRNRDYKLDNYPFITNDSNEFFKYDFNVILEGAGHAAVQDYGERILHSGTDLLVTSVGAFTDDALYQRCINAATSSGAKLIIPSAGIGALDTLAAAAVGGLTSVHMIVRKDPSAWYGTHAESVFDLPNMTKPTVIFEGSPREGAALYPQNVNISAAVSLAGMGLDLTRLTIIADTDIDTHVCEVHAEGAFGKFSFVENLAVAKTNRKTAKIVAMAVMKTVRQMVSPVIIGA